MTELEQHITTLFDVPNTNAEAIAELFGPASLKKNDYLIKSGQHGAGLSFIKSGHLRVFDYVDGKDITQYICSKGEFVTDLASLMFEKPARRYVQALTNCELHTVSATDYRTISTIVPMWDKLEKMFMAKCFMVLEDRILGFLSLSAEERYNQLFSMKQELFNEVPQHYIASMLGMTPETFSRIRKKSIS